MSARILIVDDEKNIRRTLGMILTAEGYQVRPAESGEGALEAMEETPADLILLDIGLPGVDGLETLRRIRSRYPGAEVVMISGQATVARAVEATRSGAVDFLEKPLSKERVLLAVRNALKFGRLGAELHRRRGEEEDRHRMIGESPAHRQLLDQIARVAPADATVLITGESGTGKELVARRIHQESPRSEAAFIKVNCAAIPEELIETELFGCVRGAYTGADRARDGKFLAADGGTLFLDEIGDMSLKVQAKVLRALQEREIERVGDHRTVQVDVRVLAATNKELTAEVSAGRFREDLFYRLNVIPLRVPPLRERRPDIAPLSRHFLEGYAAENGRPTPRLGADVVSRLTARRWRGNIRELRNVIERLAILVPGEEIAAEDLERLAPEPFGETGAAEALPTAEDPDRLFESIRAAGGLVAARREFEKRCIADCLERTGGNVTQAAHWLGIERSNLHKKIQYYGLDSSARRGVQAPPERDKQEGDLR